MKNDNSKSVKLPVLAILAAAFIVPWNNKERFIQALAITFTVLVVIDYMSVFYTDDSLLFSIAYIVINLFVYVGFAVTCHRIVILGNESVPVSGIVFWSKRELRFFMHGMKFVIIILIIVSLIATPLVNTGLPEKSLIALMVVVLSPIIYVLSRVVLLFPATAVDKYYDLKWSYELTEGNGIRMTIIVALIPAIMMVLSNLVYSVIDERNIIAIVFIAIGYVVMVFEIAALSLSYDYLSKNVKLEEEISLNE